MDLQKRLRAKLEALINRQEGINKAYLFDLLDKNPGRYLQYPYLFAPYFRIEPSDSMDNLALGGFLYYMNLLNFDHLYDSSAEKISKIKGDLLILGQFFTEESIKLFTRIFPPNTSFWRQWNVRKREFLETMRTEKDLTYDNFSWEAYEKIANGKVAFAKAAIDACHLLARHSNPATLPALLQAHYQVSVTAQICDDISDVRNDLRDGQFNLALQYYYQSVPREDRKEDPTEIVTEIYRNGIATELFNRAISYVRRAEEALEALPKGPFSEVLAMKRAEITNKVRAIQQFFYVEKCQDDLSEVPLPLADPGAEAEGTAERAVRGVKFLLDRLERDSWSEYITQAGLSTVWATGFVTYQIREMVTDMPWLDQQLQGVKRYLRSARTEEGLWGYNGRWSLPDADTSSIVALALADEGIFSPTTNASLATFQHRDGGIQTYHQEAALQRYLKVEEYASFAGWVQSHTSVSGMALGVAGSQPAAFTPTATDRLLTYCLAELKENAYWEGYWWSDPIYPTYCILTNLHRYFPEAVPQNLATARWLLERQNADGSWDDGRGNTAFYTGLALQLLLLFHAPSHPAVASAVEYLRTHQFADGSWASSGALLVPHPTRTETASVAADWPVKTFGTDVRSPEFQRLFTTATCTAALYRVATSTSGVTPQLKRQTVK